MTLTVLVMDATGNNKDISKDTGCKKESTNEETKATSKLAESDKNEAARLPVDRVLLRYRLFFFLFFAGFGTTFPFLGIYFKQIGLSASAVGILAGVRPLIQCIGGPFWAFLADKYKARKLVLLFSIFAWLVMTVLLVFPRPHYEVCRAVNKTTSIASAGNQEHQKKNLVPILPSRIFHSQTVESPPLPSCFPNCPESSKERLRRGISSKEPKVLVARMDANSTHQDYKQDNNINHNATTKLSKSGNTTASKKIEYVIERNYKELKDIFIILLILIVSGEFLEAPSFIMIDTALLEHLGDERAQYGKTRLFGSLGYGVASFGIGAILDKTHYQYCGKTLINYTVLFYIFAASMVLAFLFAMFGITFTYEKSNKRSSMAEALKLFCTVKIGSFLVVAWFMGFTHGGVMNFLNWYLEDLGASRLMMGMGTLSRSGAIVVGFLLSSIVIKKFGHINMILFALVAYTLSFFGYSLIPNPWYAIPIETAQGLCYSMSWSACITYLGEKAPPNATATVQGVLQGTYWGLGTGIGAFVGGIMVNNYGAVKSFRIAGILSAIVVFILIILKFTVNVKDKETTKENIAYKLIDVSETIGSAK